MPPAATQTPPSLHALLAQLIDFTGLYPPADLPMEKAIHQYGRHRREEGAWMLSRFVCAIDQLDTLDAYGLLFVQDPPFLFSALGKGGATPEIFLRTLERDLAAIKTFHDRHPQQVLVEAIETSLPQTLRGAESTEITSFLGEVAGRLDDAGLPDLELFFEIPLEEDAQDTVKPIVDAFGDETACEAALKVRLEGNAVDPQVIAAFIGACCEAGVAFKTTAGLRHPFRHYNREQETHMHGFVNVFGAAALACAHDLDSDRIQSILADENSDHFAFDGGTFRWNDLEVEADDIRWTRRHVARSLGSSSFEEVWDDLRVLDLL